MKRKRCLGHCILFAAGLLLFLPALSASGEFYKWTDSAGNVHFTDDPANIPAGSRERTSVIDTEETQPVPHAPARPGADTSAVGSVPAPTPSALKPPYRSDNRPEYPDLLKDGQVVPDMTFIGLDGTTHSVSGLRGKIVFLNFWATWCPHCRNAIPSMQRLYNELGTKRDFAMLAVTKEDPAIVKPFAAKEGMTFPVAIDTTKRAEDVFGAKGVPTTYILDRQGRVLYAHMGELDWNEPKMNAWFRALIAGE